MADAQKACSVDGCNRRVVALGYCENHYRRMKKYGDPLACAERRNSKTNRIYRTGGRFSNR